MFNNKLYVYGDQKQQIPAHINFGKFMLDRLRQIRGEKIAIEKYETKEKLTYKELTEYAVKLSVALTKLGVRKGHVVAIGSEKHILFMPTALAIVFSGAICTTYDYASGREHLNYKISIAQPEYFICTELFWKTNKDVLQTFESIKMFIILDKSLESMTSVDSLISACDVDVDLFEPARVHGQVDTAYIFYSSGTTGMPKGVLLPHINCILSSLSYNVFKDEALKVAFVLADWCHSYDFFVTYEMLGLGNKIIYAENPSHSMDIVLEVFEKQEVNIAFIVPSLLIWLSKAKEEKKHAKLGSLKSLYSTSSPLHVDTIKEMKKRFPSLKSVLQGYGMTEIGEFTSENWGSKGPRAGSVGSASPGITLKVVHPETRDVLGPNQQGEIYVRGPALMSGYINVDPKTYMDDDGFFGTGDLGYYDEDKYFYIVDRLKEVIIYDGSNIAPLELETILQKHPEVREAGVVGKPVPMFGEEPTAFVVLQPGSRVTEQDLINYVAVQVSPYMELKGGVRFISELPRNPRGKILRRRLREMLNES